MKRKLVFVMMMTCFISFGWAQDIDNVRQLIESERYSSAETLLEKNLGANEPAPEVNYLLVKTYLDQDKMEEAGKYVNRHLQGLHADADPLNRVAYARYLLNSGKKQEAETMLTAILNDRRNQKDVRLLLAMADVVIEEKEGDAKLALNWMDMAKKRDRHNPSVDIVKGLAYRKLGDASNAYLSYQQAVKEDARNTRAHYLTGKIFRAQKNTEVYMEHFMKAYAIDSTYAPVLEELYLHYYYRDVKTARKYLAKYIANTDPSLQNELYWTDILYLTGEYPAAILAAKTILDKEKANAQPRLYKLIAYSYAKSGDSANALKYISDYFAKEDPAKVIASDYEFIAGLIEKEPGQEEAAITYYTIAAEMDTLMANKSKYAATIADLYKMKKDHSKQAHWLGKLYQWKTRTNNIDLFNWGIAHYMAKEYPVTDSVFELYTTRYPEDIYGYYWRAQAAAAIDTSMTDSLAIPHYIKVAEIGEKDKEKHKKMLMKAYGYLGGFEANITKDYEASLRWFGKYQELDKDNAEVTGYIETLRKWLEDKKRAQPEGQLK